MLRKASLNKYSGGFLRAKWKEEFAVKRAYAHTSPDIRRAKYTLAVVGG